MFFFSTVAPRLIFPILLVFKGFVFLSIIAWLVFGDGWQFLATH